MQYFNRNRFISREELDSINADGGYVCYESQMLRDWTAYAEYGHTSKHQDVPLKFCGAQKSGLAVLTTRKLYAAEDERFVFAVLLVDRVFKGDDYNAGCVKNDTKYRISLTQDEAKKVLFWNYYHKNTKH